MFNYFHSVRAEMKHVSWPTRTQTIVYTVAVVAITVGTATYLGLWDYLLSMFVRTII